MVISPSPNVVDEVPPQTYLDVIVRVPVRVIDDDGVSRGKVNT